MNASILTTGSSLEIVALVAVVIADIFLSVVVYVSNPKSDTNKFFTLLTFSTVLWLLVTYLVRIPALSPFTLELHRLGIFFAAPMSLMFFLLGHTIPAEKVRLSKPAFYIAIGVTVGMMIINISPFAFVGVSASGDISSPVVGFGIIPFALISTLFSVLAVYFLIVSYRMLVGNEKRQVGLILLGIFIMLGLIILTILLPIVIFHSTFFLSLTPLYTVIFLGLTAYAVSKYELFHIKVLLAQMLTIILDIALLARVFAETNADARIVDLMLLLFMLVGGFYLVRSVKKEVAQRETIQVQKIALEKTNEQLREMDKQKNEFLSYASHQLRTPLTAIKWSASSLVDGSYGPLTAELKEPIQTIFDQSAMMAIFINDYLNVSRIEQGRMEYRFTPINLSTLLEAAAAQLRSAVEAKGITLTLQPERKKIMVWADENKLTQVFTNLIDNSLKYTPQGSIVVSSKVIDEKVVRVSIKDTGIGVEKELIEKLFEKFVRSDNARVVNTSGSGLGLFIVKTFVEAHKGNILIESEGVGKGTSFIVELPLLIQP